MSNEIIPYQELRTMAVDVFKSGMFPTMKTPEQAMSLMLLAQAENLHPMTAMRRFHIMSDGKPSMRADAMLAAYRAKGGKVIWLTDAADARAQRGKWVFEGVEQEIGYTIDEAERAGYLTKQGTNWYKDRASQLRARVITRAVRMLCPEVVVGIYTPEELEDVKATDNAPLKPVPAAQAEATVVSSQLGNGAQAAPATTPATAQAQTAQPAETREAFETRMKNVRGAFNKALQAVTDEAGFKLARKELEKAHGKEIGQVRTYVNETETFLSLMTEHWKRISGDNQNKAWREALANATDMTHLDPLVGAYLKNEVLQNHENKEALDLRGAELGHPDFQPASAGEGVPS